MSLRQWLENRWLVRRQPSREGVAVLLGVVERNLSDASVRGLSADARLGFAYEAALQCALVALLAEGFAPDRDRHHERAIGSLGLTLGLDGDRVKEVDALRRRRNTAMYEMAGVTTEAEAREAVEKAMALRDEVRRWLAKHHADLR